LIVPVGAGAVVGAGAGDGAVVVVGAGVIVGLAQPLKISPLIRITAKKMNKDFFIFALYLLNIT
jgi:hypothetical protein